MSSMHEHIHYQRESRKLKGILAASPIIQSLPASQLSARDIDCAVSLLGNDLVVICYTDFETFLKPEDIKTMPITNLCVDIAGNITVTAVNENGTIVNVRSAHPVALSTEKILSILNGEDSGEYDISELQHSWLLSLEDIRQRYEDQRSKHNAERLAFLKQAVLAYDPTFFDTMRDGSEEGLETGDLVRAKSRLYGELSLDLYDVAYIYDTVVTHDWVTRWNQSHQSVEQADCILAKINLDGILMFTPANTARLMRITEEQAICHGNDFNAAFLAEKKASILYPWGDL
jgi:hypothetical protein